MISTKVLNILKEIFFFIKNCRIFLGTTLNAVDAPAIIFFPLPLNQLNCGFAGLMTCRLQSKLSKPNADISLIDQWKKIKSGSLRIIFTGKKSIANYFNGIETIKNMEMAIAELKQEEIQEYLFFHTNRTKDLHQINEEMKTFLAAEEKLLEDHDFVINSADLEVINSRLLALKDICWMLEKDILANLKRTLVLSGEEKYSAVNPATFRKYRKLNLLLNALDRLEVRGRDSAGIQLIFVLKNEKILQNIIQQIIKKGWDDDYRRRTHKGDLLNRSIFISAGPKNDSGSISVTFTYKTYSIVG